MAFRGSLLGTPGRLLGQPGAALGSPLAPQDPPSGLFSARPVQVDARKYVLYWPVQTQSELIFNGLFRGLSAGNHPVFIADSNQAQKMGYITSVKYFLGGP